MAHALEQFEDGTSAFFSHREVPWHGLGTITESALTVGAALEMAQLNWQVTKEAIQSTIVNESGVTVIDIPNKFATVRNHPKLGYGALGVVGNRYTVMQNEDAFRFCENIVDESGAVFETAGSLYGGRKVFLTMRLPEDVLIGGQDLINNYLLVTNTHDGSEPIIAAVTNVRAVCQNTVTAALASAKTRFSVRHNGDADGRLLDAREALAVSWKYSKEFADLANGLYEKVMTKTEYSNYLDALFPAPKEEEGRTMTVWESRKAELMGLWNAPTQENIRNTEWAAYNSVVEYLDWFAPVKGNDQDIRRAERVIDGSSQEVKNKALKLLVSA